MPSATPSCNETVSANKRYLSWIDWMKAIGISVIVLGHFSSDFTVYLYVFSVQLFFWISGFLSSSNYSSSLRIAGGRSCSLWFRKLVFNLIIPMTLICICTLSINITRHILHHDFEATTLLYFIPKFIIGEHSAVINMWFVYTLIVLKLIMYYSSRIKYMPTILLAILPLMGYYINNTLEISSCALLNTTMAYPFFYIGYIMRDYKNKIDEYKNRAIEIAVLITCIAIVWLCGNYNGFVWMYTNEYGNSFILFIIGGIAGTIAILIISKWLSRFKSKIIATISRGTIIILGFHLYLVYFLKDKFPLYYDYLPFEIIATIAIIILFVPIIKMIEKRFPLIIGKYRAKTVS